MELIKAEGSSRHCQQNCVSGLTGACAPSLAVILQIPECAVWPARW